MHIIFFQYVHENVASVNSWSFTFIQKKITSARRTIYSIISVVSVLCQTNDWPELSGDLMSCMVKRSRAMGCLWTTNTAPSVFRRVPCNALSPSDFCQHTPLESLAFTAGSKRAYVPLYWSSTACLSFPGHSSNAVIRCHINIPLCT